MWWLLLDVHLAEAHARHALAEVAELVVVEGHPQLPPVRGPRVARTDRHALVVVTEPVARHGDQVRGVGDVDQTVVHLVGPAEVGRLPGVGVAGVAERVVVDPDMLGSGERERVVLRVPVAGLFIGGITGRETVVRVGDGQTQVDDVVGGSCVIPRFRGTPAWGWSRASSRRVLS